MMRQTNKWLLVALSLALCLSTSCSTLKSWVGFNEPEEAASKEPKKEEAREHEKLELKLARLWARVAELENEVLWQKQRIKLLEKGLMLGIVPEELHDEDAASTPHPPLKDNTEQHENKLLPKVKTITPHVSKNNTDNQNSNNQNNNQEILSLAQQEFEQGHYGKAIVLYSQATVEDGSNQYWIALSWLRLKEYDTALKEFQSFMQKFPNSPWIPRAKYYVAEINYHLGYREQAISALKEIIETYPNEDVAQMARSTMEKLEHNL